jgi:hypothetical protein
MPIYGKGHPAMKSAQQSKTELQWSHNTDDEALDLYA